MGGDRNRPGGFFCLTQRLGFVEQPGLVGRRRRFALFRGPSKQLLLQPAVFLFEQLYARNQLINIHFRAGLIRVDHGFLYHVENPKESANMRNRQAFVRVQTPHIMAVEQPVQMLTRRLRKARF